MVDALLALARLSSAWQRTVQWMLFLALALGFLNCFVELRFVPR